MNFDLKIRNIVLIGVFQPLTFDRYFFVKNGIISEDQIESDSLFSSEVIQFKTNYFHLTLTRSQLVLTAIKPEETNEELVGYLLKILGYAENYIITASGLNFNWFLDSGGDNLKLAELSRELCYNQENKIQKKYFDASDSTFGFYSSKNIMNCRLKLDVKPVVYNEIEKSQSFAAIQFEFNFHKDYLNIESARNELIEILKEYSTYRNEAEKIIDEIR